VRLDARDLWIEGRPVVHEIYAGLRSLIPQHESRVRSVRGRATRTAIQSHREQQSGKERYGDYGAPNLGAGALHHESEYNVRRSRQRQISTGERMRAGDEWPSVGFVDGL
jgi:hypothetical protein